jgi:hypothetical protein
MKRKLDRVSNTYLFTISMTSPEDVASLEDLRRAARDRRRQIQKSIEAFRAHGIEPAKIPELPRVKVYFRRPSKPFNARGHLYGWGGSVRKDQGPTEADVYLTNY